MKLIIVSLRLSILSYEFQTPYLYTRFFAVFV